MSKTTQAKHNADMSLVILETMGYELFMEAMAKAKDVGGLRSVLAVAYQICGHMETLAGELEDAKTKPADVRLFIAQEMATNYGPGIVKHLASTLAAAEMAAKK